MKLVRHLLVLISAALAVPAVTAQETQNQTQTQTSALPDFSAYEKRYAFHAFGEAPLYGPDFEALDYLNPDAPIGGTAKNAFSVPWQTFNSFGTGNGQSAPGIATNTYDRLMAGNLDEFFTAYTFLAEYYQMPEDRSWVLFKVRDDATWWDGTPITNRDVQFTFEKQGAEGFPGLVSQIIEPIEAIELLDDNRVLFRLSDAAAAERDFITSIASLDILPEAFWGTRSFADALLEPPFGSGPYRVSDFDMGTRLVYSRVADYWAADHPLVRGTNTDEQVIFRTIREQESERKAFLAREIDSFNEGTMRRWVNGYDAQIPLIDAGVMHKQEIESPGLKPARMAFFNLRNPKFQDARVRRALTLAFDFETMNEQFFFNRYTRNNSFYPNYGPMTATGAPEGIELALLERFADTLSPEDLAANKGAPFVNPVTAGDGDNFEQLDEAFSLLEAAGYTLEGDTLLDPSGAPYTFRIDFTTPAFEDIWQSYASSLRELGIEVELRFIDRGVWFENVRTREFEMISFDYRGSRTPGNDFLAYFSTEYTNTPNSFGFAGVSDPFIDALAEEAKIAKDLETLEAIARLVDRHMRNKNYTILFWHSQHIRLLWWDQVSRPTENGFRAPLERAATAGWWFDAEKAATLPARLEAAQ